MRNLRNIWFRFCQAISLLCGTVFFRLRLFYRGRLPYESGAILASNHQSFLDPVLVGLALEKPIHFMARSTLFKNTLFGMLIRSLNAFPVERGAADLKATKETLRRLKNGNFVVMFPEGTRTRDGSVIMPKPGFAMLASRAGVPIVPVVIKGAYKAWRRQDKFISRLPQITVIYGEPFRVDRDCAPDDVSRMLYAKWQELMKNP